MGQLGSKEAHHEVENFYKVTHLVLDEIPLHLRQYFKDAWDTKYPTTPWDDSPTSGNLLLTKELNNKTSKAIGQRVQHGDRNKWDGTVLFAVLLFSSQKFVKQSSNEYSCIDKLRIMRNTHFAHLESAELQNSDCQQIFSDARQIFLQMKWPLNGIKAIENSTINKTGRMRLLEQLKEERNKHDSLVKKVRTVEDGLAKLQTDIGLRNQEFTRRLDDTGNKLRIRISVLMWIHRVCYQLLSSKA